MSHSAELMNPIPPISAASWYTSAKSPVFRLDRDRASLQWVASLKSKRRNSSAADGANSGFLMSTPRTQYPSALRRLTRWLAMNPPAPHTSARFIRHHPRRSADEEQNVIEIWSNWGWEENGRPHPAVQGIGT